MRDLLLQHDRTQTESGDKSKALVEQLEKFATDVKSSIQRTQEEANRTQQAITALIDSTKADGSSLVIRSGPGGEHDRSVFDPRDYKIEALQTQFALGAWKK